MKHWYLTSLFLFLIAATAVAQPTVSSTNPQRHGFTQSNTVTVNFSEAMDNATINTSTVIVQGSFRGKYSGSFGFSGNSATFTPSEAFLPNETITVTVTTGVQNSSNVALVDPFVATYIRRPSAGPNKWSDRVNYTVHGSDRTSKTVLADLNGDGHLDVVALTPGQDRLSIYLNDGQGGYGTPTTYNTSTNVVDVVVADVNNDGHIDVLTGNLSAYALSVFANDGNGGLTKTDYATGNSRPAYNLVAADLDGDGWIDVAISDADATDIYFFFNDGDGTFDAAATQFDSVVGLSSLLAADVDGVSTSGDGRLDIVALDSAGNLRYIRNDGGRTFTLITTTFPVGALPQALFIANWAGRPNPISANYDSDNITIWQASTVTSRAIGTTSTFSAGNGPIAVTSADFNNDGNNDIVVSNALGNSLSFLGNNGAPSNSQSTFSNSLTYSMGSTYANHLTMGDIDGDGDLDIITANQDGTFSVVLNFDGPLVESVSPDNAADSVSLASNVTVTFSHDVSNVNASRFRLIGSISGEIDGAVSYDSGTKTATFDPTADFLPGETVTVLVANSIQTAGGVALQRGYTTSFRVAVSGGGDTFASAATIGVGNGPVKALLVDLNADGNADLITLNNAADSVAVRLGTGTGTFGASTNYYAGTAPNAIAIGDVTGDGNVDLLVTGSESVISRLNGNGDGTFNARSTTALSGAASQIALVDRDLDGDLDVVYTLGGQVRSMLNNGSGTFDTGSEFGYNTGSSNIVSGDLYGNGYPEFVYANSGTNALVVSRYTGTFWTSSSYSLGSQPAWVALGDVDGDGDLDVVSANLSFGAGSISVLFNDGVGNLSGLTTTTLTSSSAPRDIQMIDVDGDGDLDLLIADSANNRVIRMINNGSGGFTESGAFAAGTYPNSIAVADLNGDGDSDYLVANRDSDDVTRLLNSTALDLVSYSPAPFRAGVAADADIEFVFNQTMDPSDVEIIVRGSVSGVVSGAWSFDVPTSTATFNPTNDFIIGETVTVIVDQSGFEAANGTALSGLLSWSFSIGSTEGRSMFVTSGSIPISGSIPNPADIAVGDINNDGIADIVLEKNGAFEAFLGDGMGGFVSQGTISMGSGVVPFDVDLADLNGDGDLDAILTAQDTGNGYVNSQYIFFGDGLGAFSTTADVTISNESPGSDAYRIIVDVDLDGDLDLIIGNSNPKVYINNGTAGFTLQQSITPSAGSNSRAYTAGDVNGDGYPDLIMIVYANAIVQVSLNNGSGSFGTPTTIWNGATEPSSISVADYNQDGDLDIALLLDDETIRVLFNNGSAVFTETQSITTTTYDIDPSVDINGDGFPELIVRGYGEFSIVMNDNGTFEPETKVNTSHNVNRVGVMDIDGDGMVELLMGNSSNKSIDIYKQQDNVEVVSVSPVNAALDQANNPTVTITFDVPMDGTTFTASNASIVGSLSGAIAGSFNVVGSTATFTPSGTFLPGELVTVSLTTGLKATSGDRLVNPFTSSFTVAADGYGSLAFDANALSSVGSGVGRMTAGDFDGDGEVDLAVYVFGSPNTIKIMTNTAGVFTETASISLTSEVYAMRTLDVNNDGHTDLFLMTSGTGLYSQQYLRGTFLLNDGTGGFPADLTSPGAYQTPLSPMTPSFSGSFLEAVDLNGDGLVDVAIRTGNQLFYGSFQSTGFSFSDFRIVINGSEAASGSFADMNNDGIPDLVSGYDGSPGAFVTLGIGGGSFDESSERSGNYRGRHSAVGDFNGDGYLDFVSGGEHSDSGYGFDVYLNDGSGNLSTPIAYHLGDFEVEGLKAGDIDGDGDIDLWIKIGDYYDSNDNYVEPILIAYNNGSAGFGNQIQFFVPYEDPDYFYDFNSMTIADFDGDGRLDAAGMINGNRIALMKNQSGGIAGAPTVAATAAGSTGVSYNKATITWTNGDGARRFVVVKEGAAVDASPANDGNYQPSGVFGSGSEIGTGNFVVYGGVGSSVTLSGLDAETTYHVAVYETNGIPGAERILTTDPATASFTTSPAPIIFPLSGTTVTFTKADNADWTLEQNQDRISDIVWITRQNSDGLFNSALESSYGSGNGRIEWAYGSASDISILAFKGFKDAVSDWGSLSNVDDDGPVELVLHLIDSGVYIEMELTQWTSGQNGGGFSYTRGDGIVPSPPVPDFDTVAGNALSLDGVDDRAEFTIQSSEGGSSEFGQLAKASVTTNPLMEIASTYTGDEVPQSFTAELWVKVGDPQTDAAIFARAREGAGSSSSGRPYSIRVKNGAFSFQFYDYNGDQFVDGSTQIVADTWYHVAATVAFTPGDESADTYTLRLFVNGREEGTSIDVNDRASQITRTYYLGYDGSTYFEGEIDEFRFWNKARTAAEIREYQFRTYDQFGLGLIGYWQFNETSGSTASELKHEIEMSLVGGPSFATSSVPVGAGTVATVSNFSSGTQTVGNTSITLQGTTGEPLEVTVTELETTPNVFPEGIGASLGGKVFVIDVFGDLGSATADITLNFGSGVVTAEQEANPAMLGLFKRGSTSTGEWLNLGGATTAIASSGLVTWTGISSFSQFMAAELPPIDLIGVDDLDVTVFNNTYVFDPGLFEIFGTYSDSTFTITTDVNPEGTLFVDVNDNDVFDEGTDIAINTTGGTFVPGNLAERLTYSAGQQGIETLSLAFEATDGAADTLSVTFTTVIAYPSLSGVADEGGWYLLTNPLDTPLSTLFSTIWTQGAVNSNAPAGNATLYTYNVSTSAFEAITTDLETTTLGAGTGILAYIFAFDDYSEGIPEGGGWPKQLNNEGNPFAVSQSLPFKNVDHDGLTGTSGTEGFNLIGNPYGWAMSADSLIATLKRADALANSYLYRWNPVHRTYQLITSGAIEPYESVFTRAITSGLDQTVAFDYGDRHAIFTKEVAEPLFAFTLRHAEANLESVSNLRFDEKGSIGIDPFDGYYLGTYSRTFANLYTQVGDQSLVIHNLPGGLDREITIPIHLHASVSGSFELEWDASLLPKGWEFILEDKATGALILLDEAASHRFTVNRLAKSAETVFGQSPVTQGAEPVFLLHVRPPNVVSVGTDELLPTEVELSQNYPNPFNPTTQIRYGVPTQSAVRLEVFDVLGRRVSVLVDQQSVAPGRHTVAFDASRLASGVYIYRLTVGSKVLTNRMVLIK